MILQNTCPGLPTMHFRRWG